MISDIEHDFPPKSEILLTETHEVLLKFGSFKTPNIHVFKMAAPTEDRFPQTIL